MGFDEEFSTVCLILRSGAETAGVDAFALSLIKAERQARKLFTYLVYQSPAFTATHIHELRHTLAANRRVYFRGVIAGIDALSPVTVKNLIGQEYDRLWLRFKAFNQHRSKIFHGQITHKGLSRDDLVQNAADIKTWSQTLAGAAGQQLGYGGFGRNSFRKSSDPNFSSRLRASINNVKEYAQFISTHMEAPPKQNSG